jgi:hypothetical protein
VSGVAVIRGLLAANAALIAAVPATKIVAGDLPLGTDMPAIHITSIDAVRRNTVSMSEAKTLVTERVQVTVMVGRSANAGGDYPGLVSTLALVRRACPNTRGVVNGVTVDSVLPDTEGPDIALDDVGIVSRSQDFIVRWVETR